MSVARRSRRSDFFFKELVAQTPEELNALSFVVFFKGFETHTPESSSSKLGDYYYFF